MVAVFVLGVFCAVGVNDAHAGSLTVSVTDSSADLNLVAAEGGIAYGESDTASFSVSTTSSGGYTVTMTGGNDSGRLVGTDNNNYFSPITSAIASPGDFSNGTWGFKPSTYNSVSNTSYQPVITSSDTAVIDITNSPMTGNYTLAVAAKTDTNTEADTYSYNFVVSATTNAIDYDIAFIDPGDDLPARMIDSTTGSTVTLPNNIPTRSGYAFAGWCTNSVSPGSACTGTTYQPGAAYTLDAGTNNAISLYALWTPLCAGQAYIMQNISSWKSSLGTGATVTACDNRDNTTYTVGKLADGKVWMLDNLALGSTDRTYHLTDNDTHLPGGGSYDLPASTAGGAWQNSYTASYINADYKTTVPSDATSQSGGYKIGVYYNYCAATANTICADSTTTEASYDICPKGWRLPTGGSSGEFQALYNNSSYNNYANYRAALHLPLSGRFSGGSPTNQGGRGLWWSTTAYDGRDRHDLDVVNSGIYPTNRDYRYYGFSIRCVAQ